MPTPLRWTRLNLDLYCSLLQAVGASGAIFGMVGAWGAFCLMNESVLGRATSQRALQSVAQTVMLNVAYGMSSSQIDNMGHLGVRARGGICTNLNSAL